MNRKQKNLLMNGIILPAVIALAVTAVYFLILPSVKSQFPFQKEQIVLAEYENNEVNNIYKSPVNPDSSEIKRDALDSISENTVFAYAVIGGREYQIIYGADDKNSVGRLNADKNGVLPGEAGCVYLGAAKADGEEIRALKAGDVVKINTSYASYEYKIIETQTLGSKNDIPKLAEGVGRSAVFYTSSGENAGISDGYFAAAAEMSGGVEVNG